MGCKSRYMPFSYSEQTIYIIQITFSNALHWWKILLLYRNSLNHIFDYLIDNKPYYRQWRGQGYNYILYKWRPCRFIFDCLCRNELWQTPKWSVPPFAVMMSGYWAPHLYLAPNNSPVGHVCSTCKSYRFPDPPDLGCLQTVRNITNE